MLGIGLAIGCGPAARRACGLHCLETPLFSWELTFEHFKFDQTTAILVVTEVGGRGFSETYSGYQSHAPFDDFFPFQKLSFGGRQSNVSMTMVVFISCQFHGDVRSSWDQV